MIFDHSHLLFLSVFLFGYFMGSIPFGLLLSKLSGLGDIRKVGSGNIGATNVLRTGNKKIALLTLILDGTKGALAIYIVSISQNIIEFNLTNNINLFQSLVAVSAVIGHCFPIWLNFKGGKGVATGFGTIIFLNMYVGVIALLIWLSIAKLFRISSLSGITHSRSKTTTSLLWLEIWSLRMKYVLSVSSLVLTSSLLLQLSKNLAVLL